MAAPSRMIFCSAYVISGSGELLPCCGEEIGKGVAIVADAVHRAVMQPIARSSISRYSFTLHVASGFQMVGQNERRHRDGECLKHLVCQIVW